MFTRVIELTSKPGKSKELANAINAKALLILKQQRGFADETRLTCIPLSDTELRPKRLPETTAPRSDQTFKPPYD